MKTPPRTSPESSFACKIYTRGKQAADDLLLRRVIENNQTKGYSNMETTTASGAVATAQPAKLLYTAKAHTTGGRDGGASRTSDGRLDVKLTLPGAPGNGTNPEQLFAAGWSACFIGAIKHVAAKMKVKLPQDLAVDPEVELWNGDEGYFLKARLNVSLPGLERQLAESILEGAHQTCPYSKATRGNIDVAINLVETGPAKSY
jgi:Ohr subfamily peroxiredoxin